MKVRQYDASIYGDKTYILEVRGTISEAELRDSPQNLTLQGALAFRSAASVKSAACSLLTEINLSFFYFVGEMKQVYKSE